MGIAGQAIFWWGEVYFLILKEGCGDPQLNKGHDARGLPSKKFSGFHKTSLTGGLILEKIFYSRMAFTGLASKVWTTKKAIILTIFIQFNKQ